MRDYLYIWNDPGKQCIITSGIQFRDIAENIGLNGGLVLLEHNAGYFECDMKTGFEYVPRKDIPELAKENIYHWGNFTWADYKGGSFPELPDREIAELAFFRQVRRPLDQIALPCLGNKYICYIHDDDWFMQLYYSSWDDVSALISALYPQLDLAALQSGKTAYWLSGDSIDVEERTLDIDAVLNRIP